MPSVNDRRDTICDHGQRVIETMGLKKTFLNVDQSYGINKPSGQIIVSFHIGSQKIP